MFNSHILQGVLEGTFLKNLLKGLGGTFIKVGTFIRYKIVPLEIWPKDEFFLEFFKFEQDGSKRPSFDTDTNMIVLSS